MEDATSRRLAFATASAVPRANIRAKRVLDLMLGVSVAVLASPLLLLIWVSYKLSGIVFQEDRGPVFRQIYRHAYGRVIPVYKIRVPTMKAIDAGLSKIADEKVVWLSGELGEDAQCLEDRTLHRLVEDTDLDSTRFGRLMKAMYLDELPQIINVVKGDMSLVGPRPVPLHDWRCCPDHDGLVTHRGKSFDYRHRDKLPGGLTGLYQANKSAAAKVDYGTFLEEGIALDKQYYELLLRATPWKIFKADLAIMCRTIPVLLRHEGV